MSSLLADWKALRKKSRAEAIRAHINALEVRRRRIQAKQLKLTNQAELLEGGCAICKQGPDKGKPILTGPPLILQPHQSKHADPIN